MKNVSKGKAEAQDFVRFRLQNLIMRMNNERDEPRRDDSRQDKKKW